MEEKVKTAPSNHRKLLAIGLPATLCWAFAFFSTDFLQSYTQGLFIWLPLVLGATSTLIYGYDQTVSRGKLFRISFVTLLVFSLGLLLFAWEGLICLIMAFPFGLLFTWVGHWIGYQILKSKVGNTSALVMLLFLSVPSFMAFEIIQPEEEELRSVVTSVEIDASPEQVWKNVIAFSPLEEPSELIFQTGIAYPVNATISGAGVGAVRHCNFSTGSFVEPITVWEESRLLRFSVEQQPATMKELSPYDIQPNHLHGYWVSKEGQFKLTKLPNGHTLLEGTTWYQSKIKPGWYWSIWSDYIVHAIHKRVMNHIKTQSEKR